MVRSADNSRQTIMADEKKETGRVEAFSDGVIAIAITLLAFGIAVPSREESAAAGGLLPALLDNWPDYFAYLTSFMVILIMWINHHRMFTMFRRVDHNFLILNGLLLAAVSLIPFTTDLVAEYLRQPEANIAAAVYCSLSLVIALLFQALLRYACHHRRLLLPSIPDEAIAAIFRQYRFGPLIYFTAIVLALLDARVGVGLIALIALWFALPSRREDNERIVT
jgi:uncharacterized membrane protein